MLVTILSSLVNGLQICKLYYLLAWAWGLQYSLRPQASHRDQEQGHSFFPIWADQGQQIACLLFSQQLIALKVAFSVLNFNWRHLV